MVATYMYAPRGSKATPATSSRSVDSMRSRHGGRVWAGADVGGADDEDAEARVEVEVASETEVGDEGKVEGAKVESSEEEVNKLVGDMAASSAV